MNTIYSTYTNATKIFGLELKIFSEMERYKI